MLIPVPPKVQLYSSKAGEFGMKNTLICHVSGFHPPDITIQLMKNGEELKGTNQTDLAFDDKWQFRLSKSVFFTPQNGEKYTCKVTHGMKTNDHTWGEFQSAKMCDVCSHSKRETREM